MIRNIIATEAIQAVVVSAMIRQGFDLDRVCNGLFELHKGDDAIQIGTDHNTVIIYNYPGEKAVKSAEAAGDVE
jgi:hypothetical protein